MAKVTKDLVRGSSDPSVVQTYATKGFKHEGVSGSTPVTRLTETKTSDMITPQVMTENNTAVKKLVKDEVKGAAVGPGMTVDSGKVKGISAQASQSAGNVGSSNVNHS